MGQYVSTKLSHIENFISLPRVMHRIAISILDNYFTLPDFRRPFTEI